MIRDADGAIGICMLDTGLRGCPPERTVRSTSIAGPGEWTHVVATASSGRLSLFVQGRLSSSGPGGSVPQGPERHDFRIGGSFGEDHTFAGKIDEVQLFRQPLTADEVSRLFEADRDGLCYR